MAEPLTTKAAEIRAGLVNRLREHVRSRGGLSRDAETGEIVLPNGAWAMMLEAADLIEQQAAELAEARGENERLAGLIASLRQACAAHAEAGKALHGAYEVMEARATTAESELAAERQRSDTLRVQRDGHAAELAEKAGIYDEQVTRAEKQWQAWEARATTAESERDEARAALQVAKDGWRDAEDAAKTLAAERDELLREKERLEAALQKLHDAASVFHNAALVHLSDTTFDSDGGLSEADAELSVNALPGARSALENGPAGLADANSKSPSPASQSERIAVLEAALQEKDRVVHLYGKHDKMTDREKLGAIINHPSFARAALAPLGEE